MEFSNRFRKDFQNLCDLCGDICELDSVISIDLINDNFFLTEYLDKVVKDVDPIRVFLKGSRNCYFRDFNSINFFSFEDFIINSSLERFSSLLSILSSDFYGKKRISLLDSFYIFFESFKKHISLKKKDFTIFVEYGCYLLNLYREFLLCKRFLDSKFVERNFLKEVNSFLNSFSVGSLLSAEIIEEVFNEIQNFKEEKDFFDYYDFMSSFLDLFYKGNVDISSLYFDSSKFISFFERPNLSFSGLDIFFVSEEWSIFDLFLLFLNIFSDLSVVLSSDVKDDVLSISKKKIVFSKGFLNKCSDLSINFSKVLNDYSEINSSCESFFISDNCDFSKCLSNSFSIIKFNRSEDYLIKWDILKNIRKFSDSENGSAINYIYFEDYNDLGSILSDVLNRGYKLEDFKNFESFLVNSKLIGRVMSILKIITDKNGSNISWFNLLDFCHVEFSVIQQLFKKSRMLNKSVYRLLTTKFNLIENDFVNEKDVLLNIGRYINLLIQEYHNGCSLSHLVRRVLSVFNFYEFALSLRSELEVFLLNSFLKLVVHFEEFFNSSSLNDFLEYLSFLMGLELRDIFVNLRLFNSEIIIIHRSNLCSGFIPKDSNVFIIDKKSNLIFDKYLSFSFLNFDFYKLRDHMCERLCQFSYLNNDVYVYIVDSERISYLSSKLGSVSYAELSIDDFDLQKDFMFDISDLKGLLSVYLSRSVLFEDFDTTEVILSIMKSLNSGLSFSEIKDGLLSNSSFKRDSVKKVLRFIDLNISSERESGGLLINQILFNDYDFKFSVSKLKCYETCPAKYLFSYVYSVPESSKVFFEFGSIIHKVLEEIQPSVGKVSREILYAKAVSRFKCLWKSDVFLSEDLEIEYFEKGLRMIMDFIIKEEELKRVSIDRETIFREKKFEIKFAGEILIGVIDRIDKIGDSDFEVIDYKTSKSSLSKYKLQTDLQLFIYSLACKEILGKVPKYISLWFLDESKIVRIKSEDLKYDFLVNKVLEIIKSIKNRVFVPVRNGLCDYCEYREICKNFSFNYNDFK